MRRRKKVMAMEMQMIPINFVYLKKKRNVFRQNYYW